MSLASRLMLDRKVDAENPINNYTTKQPSSNHKKGHQPHNHGRHHSTSNNTGGTKRGLLSARQPFANITNNSNNGANSGTSFHQQKGTVFKSNTVASPFSINKTKRRVKLVAEDDPIDKCSYYDPYEDISYVDPMIEKVLPNVVELFKTAPNNGLLSIDDLDSLSDESSFDFIDISDDGLDSWKDEFNMEDVDSLDIDFDPIEFSDDFEDLIL
eukprot:TRINITY_DN10320_c0_g1_i1.p1 TRINITY_DN10320_c0_g1~~TRINITY_DN10320_c0_g1_i1.p1  ORF type:complete len:226 (-),score=43.72 TRINITY_DN10320_c0_g1_i1:57-695(-)